jgi:DNA-binding CsgD family transcriptional regulator
MRVVVWNRAATEITGYEAPEVLGRLCYLKGNTLELERFCRAECPIAREGGSPLVCELCIKGWQRFSTMAVPVRHEDVACLILILRQVPFPLQLLTRLDALLTRFAAPQEPRGPPAPPRPLALTPREREILRLLAAGKTAKPIATELAVSLPTVRTHIQNLLCKLEVHSCLEAVVWYFRGRLADPESRSWRPPGLLPLPRP